MTISVSEGDTTGNEVARLEVAPEGVVIGKVALGDLVGENFAPEDALAEDVVGVVVSSDEGPPCKELPGSGPSVRVIPSVVKVTTPVIVGN